MTEVEGQQDRAVHFSSRDQIKVQDKEVLSDAGPFEGFGHTPSTGYEHGSIEALVDTNEKLRASLSEFQVELKKGFASINRALLILVGEVRNVNVSTVSTHIHAMEELAASHGTTGHEPIRARYAEVLDEVIVEAALYGAGPIEIVGET